MFFVYILRLADETLYTGYTKDIPNRVKLHSSGRGSKYVGSRLPLELVYVEQYNNRSDAMRREIVIKKLRRKVKLDLIHSFDNTELKGILGSTIL